MSPEERIAKLEALLERVTRRRAEPRDEGAGPSLARVAATGEVHWPFPPRPPAPVREAPRTPIPLGEDVTLLERTLVTVVDAPPRAPEPSRVRAIEAIETSFAEPPPVEHMDLELETDTSLVPPSDRDPFASEPHLLESRSRLVAATPERAFDRPGSLGLEEDLTSTPTPLTPRGLDEARDASTSATDFAPRAVGPSVIDGLDELDEPAPASSRRPITLEEKMSELEGEDDALHAAPPASGRQPAVPPIDLDVSPDVGAITGEERVAERPHERPREPSPEWARDRVQIARDAPEVMRASPATSDAVAAFVGRTPEPRPATFGELLDDALAI